MKKGYWKCYEIDDCITVCARSAREAIEWAIKEQVTDKDNLYVPPVEVNMKKQYMSYTIGEMPVKRHKSKPTETWEGEDAICISIKRAIRYFIKKKRPNEPFIICTSY